MKLHIVFFSQDFGENMEDKFLQFFPFFEYIPRTFVLTKLRNNNIKNNSPADFRKTTAKNLYKKFIKTVQICGCYWASFQRARSRSVEEYVPGKCA